MLVLEDSKTIKKNNGLCILWDKYLGQVYNFRKGKTEFLMLSQNSPLPLSLHTSSWFSSSSSFPSCVSLNFFCASFSFSLFFLQKRCQNQMMNRKMILNHLNSQNHWMRTVTCAFSSPPSWL